MNNCCYYKYNILQAFVVRSPSNTDISVELAGRHLRSEQTRLQSGEGSLRFIMMILLSMMMVTMMGGLRLMMIMMILMMMFLVMLMRGNDCVDYHGANSYKY